MSTIFAHFAPKISTNPTQYLNAIQRLFPGFYVTWYADPFVFMGVLHRIRRNAEDSLVHQKQPKLTVCADATITNRQHLIASLKLAPQTSTAGIILAAYLRWDKNCVKQLDGDFTFVIYDHTKKQSFCARDRMGIRLLFYHQQNATLSLASNINCLHPFANEAGLSHAYLQRTMTFNYRWGFPFDLQTLFETIYKFPPAHLFVWDGACIQQEKYWHLGEEKAKQSASLKIAIHDFEEYLAQAINKYHSCYSDIAIEISGGLDSAAVALYSKLANADVNLYGLSHTFPDDIPESEKSFAACAELHHAQAISDFLNIPLHTIEKKFYASMPSLLPKLAEWIGGSAAYTATIKNYPLVQYAANLECQAIFSGLGGDEFVSTRAWPALQELKSSGKNILWFYERMCLSSVAGVFKNAFKLKHRSKNIVQNGFIADRREIIQKVFCQEWVEWIQKYQRDRMIIHDQRTQERHYYDGEYAQGLYARLEESYQVAQYFGINYHFPLLDWELVNYFHQLPSNYKRRHGKGRYLFQKVLLSHFPKALVKRNTKETVTIPAYRYDFGQTAHQLFQKQPVLAELEYLQGCVHFDNILELLQKYPYDNHLNGLLFRYFLLSKGLQTQAMLAPCNDL